MKPDGRIAVKTGKVDIGQRISTALAVIAAEELDVPLDRIEMIRTVTGEAPEPAVVGAGDFDPADHAAFAEIAEFVFGGPPRGQ